jgi:predicted nucleic acid-binding protein
MRACYLDTSCLVAIAFGEEGAVGHGRRLEACSPILSANLLEAEFRSALAREGVADDGSLLLASVSWILPDRRLTAEIERVLVVGHARGADLWHLACALYAAESPADLPFFTVDARQRELAAALGFPTPV